MNQDIRARIAQQAADGVALHQVVVGAAWHKNILCAVLAQFVDDEGTEETCAVLAHDAYASAVPKAGLMIVVSGLVHGRVFLRLIRLLRPTLRGRNGGIGL
jgi:hypothetical protein